MSTDLLTTEEAAKRLGIRPNTLAHWRLNGKGPRFLKVGRMHVRYRPEDIERWIEAHMVTPGREAAS